MLVNEKDLGLTIALMSKTDLENYQVCFPIPDFKYVKNNYTYEPSADSIFCIFSNSHLVDDYCTFLQEHVFPNFVKWEKCNNPMGGDYYSDSYSVWFDADEEILLYYRLKMSN